LHEGGGSGGGEGEGGDCNEGRAASPLARVCAREVMVVVVVMKVVVVVVGDAFGVVVEMVGG
jgi:hypothetical protein